MAQFALLPIACDSPEIKPLPPPAAGVVLVVIDALRADHLKSYGYERDTGPNLDRLAREGARFETALAPSSWALPSLVTLLTGLPPEQHGVVRAGLALTDDALTLTEVLAEAGFETVAIVAGSDSEPGRGISQGFDRYIQVTREAFAKGEVASEVDSFLTAWDRAGRVSPFFLFVHMPLVASGDPLPQQASELEQAMDRYDRGIGYADSQLGLILRKLEGLELSRDTLVIATSSHGQEFLERGNIGHGNTLHRESVRVPLIVRFPREVEAGKIIAQPARLNDLGATVMMLTRILEPAEFGFHHSAHGFSNRDLTELLVGDWNGMDVIVAGDLAGKSRSLRLGDYKLIQRDDQPAELFNLKLDPEEKRDISGAEIRRTEVYSKKLETWRSICAERPQYAKLYRPSEP